MANNEDLNQANDGSPAADIPDLKKKEKERKKAGTAWSGAKPGAGSFSGATGGTVARAAASAAASAAGVGGATAEAAGASWLSSLIASLTATVLGKMLVAAGVAAFMIGAGMVGYALLKGGTGAAGVGDLGALSDSMKVRMGGGDRTGVASNGEIRFDPLTKAAAAKKPDAPADDKAKGEAVPPPAQTADAADPNAGWNRPGLEHNLSGSKLSSSLGGGFGGKNIFAGSSSAPKFDAGLGKVNIKGGEKGRLSVSKNAATGRVVRGGQGKQLKSNKAFGQLKLAKGMSALGTSASSAEGARTTAANAFDGQTSPNTLAGGTPGGAGTDPGAVTSPSSDGGAPDVTSPNVDIPTGVAVDQDSAAMLALIASMAKQAGELKKKAAEMMVEGLALIVVGGLLILAGCTIWTAWLIPIGAMLVGLGGMLVGMSMMMSQMASMMKDMSDSMSTSLSQRTGNTNQDATNKYCIDKAYNDATDPKDCNPPDDVTGGKTFDQNDSDQVQEHKDMVTKDTLVQ